MVPELVVLVTPTSARDVTVVGSLAELFPGVRSPPPPTVALFVTVPGADCSTATVTVIAGNNQAAAGPTDRVQVPPWATPPRVHPDPDAHEAALPPGRVR